MRRCDRSSELWERIEEEGRAAREGDFYTVSA